MSLEVDNRPCSSCGKATKSERETVNYGCGDLLMVVLTTGLWVLFRYAMRPGWKCSTCGRGT